VNAPEIRREGDLYRLRWPESIEIDACRVHDGREGLSAEIAIRASLPGLSSPHLALCRVNLLSTTGRRNLISLLETRTGGADINWPRILEEAAILITQAARAGEPVIRLGQQGRPERQPWLVGGLLRRNEHTVVFGYKGTFKSGLGRAIAYDVVTGIPHLGLTVEQGPVLCLDWECDAATAEEGLWLLAAGLGDESPPPVLYRRMTRPLVEDLTAVRRTRDRESVILTIIDSQGLAIGQGSGRDPADAVLAFYGAAREIGGTILGIDHRSHEDAHSKRPSPYGSIYKMNAARSLWLAKTAQEPGASDLHVGLFHQLANNYGLQRPIGFHVTFSEDAVRVEPEDARDVPLLREGLSAGERCWLALTQPMSTKALAQELGLKENTITTACGRHPGIIKVGYDGQAATWARRADREESDG
jgi:hypothetical protein